MEGRSLRIHDEAHLRALAEADQQERKNHPPYGTPDYWAMRHRDAQRRERVKELEKSGTILSAEDNFHAALIFQHGETIEDIWQAHTYASRAVDLGSRPARWLAAASYDRWLMYQGRPQKYGTQMVPDGKRYRLWDVDPDTTDAEREEWDVPTLREQLDRADDMTRTTPLPPMHDAPEWLREALKRW